jgi:hypothetical protein
MRLPLTGVETITRQRGNDSWPPAIAFEAFAASAKQVVGSILRDDALVDEGRIQQAKVAELRQALELEVEADQTRAQADAQLEARREQSEQERKRVEEQARQREQAIEREKAAAEQQAARDAREKAETVGKIDQLREKRVTATERQARLVRVNEESAVLAQQRQAVKAKDTAVKAAQAVEQKKAARKRA